MKNYFLLFLIMTIGNSFGQFAVVDAAANTTLGTISSSLVSTNTSLQKIYVQNEKTNSYLKEILSELKKLNDTSKDQKNILDEELKAKKTTPDYVFGSRELQDALELKKKIIDAYNSGRRTVNSLKYLKSKEIDDFVTFSASTIIKAKSFFSESKKILETKSIIQPEERLKRIDSINKELEYILDSFINYTNQLKSINHNRKSKESLINLSKN